MYLTIDGRRIETQPDKRLLDLVRRLGLETERLSNRPLAAKIAGEVFTLNYIPQRSRDTVPEKASVRRAMAASGGVVHLLRYGDEAGKECYIRTAQFVVFLALRQLWPKARGKMNCTLGSSVYIEVEGAERFSVTALKERIAALVAQDIPLILLRSPHSCIFSLWWEVLHILTGASSPESTRAAECSLIRSGTGENFPARPSESSALET